MEKFYYNYKYIIIGITVWISIQFFKFLYDSIANKKLMFSRFWGSGGMPSSHSAVVTSLATMIAKHEGLNSPIFAVACGFAFIVMYDACNLRKAVGNQAKFLNDLLKEKNTTNYEKFQELTGHTVIQVIAGFVIGLVVGIIA
jgi:acid phosphatase family membrane protein YuiD